MKNIIYILIAFSLLVLSACAKSHTINKNNLLNSNKTPDEISKETLSQIVSCFEKGNKVQLKELMSNYIIANDSQLDNEIDDAFDFIDGKIISYDKPFANAMGSHEKKACGGRVTNIITENGTEYSISFTGWLTYDIDESKIGVEGIRIVNDTKGAEYPYDATEKELVDCMIKIGHFE